MGEKFSKKSAIKLFLAFFLLLLMLYANFYAVKRMEHYAVQAYFYQRMSVAFDIAQVPAVKQQISQIMLEKDNPRQRELAKKLESRLDNTKDPGIYLDSMLEQDKAGLKRVKLLREVAFVLLILLAFVQFLLKRKLS
ncbi:MAG: hypothetical protein WCY12_03460 [Candidatus Omnitrophota bacterium]